MPFVDFAIGAYFGGQERPKDPVRAQTARILFPPRTVSDMEIDFVAQSQNVGVNDLSECFSLVLQIVP